jgi:hypothetical protein
MVHTRTSKHVILQKKKITAFRHVFCTLRREVIHAEIFCKRGGRERPGLERKEEIATMIDHDASAEEKKKNYQEYTPAADILGNP